MNKKLQQYIVSVKKFNEKWEPTGKMIKENQYTLVQTWKSKIGFPDGIFTQRKYAEKQILLTKV